MEAIFNTETLLHRDQYEDITADLWDMYIGDASTRTRGYNEWLCSLLRNYNCKRVLDAATGTGVDSEMLFDEGFEVTSIDNSSEMLQKAEELKNKKRGDPRADTWFIYQANWLQLEQDLSTSGALDQGQYDAVLLLGNSFTHLPNEDQKFTLQKIAMQNFRKVLRPGGILVLDHRNYDTAMNGSPGVQKKNLYYTGNRLEKMDTYMIAKNGKFNLVVLDVFLNVAKSVKDSDKKVKNFKLFLYPLSLESVNSLIEDNFKPKKHVLYADFEVFDPKKNTQPGFFCHVAQKH